MRARRVPLLLAAVLVGAACAHAPALRAGTDPLATRVIPLGMGIALPASETILEFPPDQHYRFVPPDSLVRGMTSEDAASVRGMTPFQASLGVVLQSQGWRESADSADYDIAIFVAQRTAMRTEIREELVASTEASGLPRCDASRMGNQPRCTNERDRTRQVRVSVPYTEARLYHVIRRRSDGAVRYWAHGQPLNETVQAAVARDLLRLFIVPKD
jgi:hypothetical protein